MNIIFSLASSMPPMNASLKLTYTQKYKFLLILLPILLLSAFPHASYGDQYVHLDFEKGSLVSGEIDGSGMRHDIYNNDYKIYREGLGIDDSKSNIWVSTMMGRKTFSGDRSLGIHIANYYDKNIGKDRVELTVVPYDDEKALKFGKVRYFGFAFYIGNAHKFTGSTHIAQVWQWKNKSTNEILFFSLDADEFKLKKQYADVHKVIYNISNKPILKEKWYTVIVKLNPSYNGDGRGGQIKVWFAKEGDEIVKDSPTLVQNIDWGVKPINCLGKKLSVDEHDSFTCGVFDIRVGGYRANNKDDREHHIYFDEIKYASTFSEANPRIVRQWEFKNDTEGWGNATRIGVFKQVQGKLVCQINANDPYFKSPDNLNISLLEFKKIKIKMKASNTNDFRRAKIYFTTSDDSAWDEDKTKTFPILRDGRSNVYTIDMTDKFSSESGKLKQLRIDLIPGGNEIFEIDYIRIQK